MVGMWFPGLVGCRTPSALSRVRGWDKHWPSRFLGFVPTHSWLERLRRFGLDVLAPLGCPVETKSPSTGAQGNNGEGWLWRSTAQCHAALRWPDHVDIEWSLRGAMRGRALPRAVRSPSPPRSRAAFRTSPAHRGHDPAPHQGAGRENRAAYTRPWGSSPCRARPAPLDAVGGRRHSWARASLLAASGRHGTAFDRRRAFPLTGEGARKRRPLAFDTFRAEVSYMRRHHHLHTGGNRRCDASWERAALAPARQQRWRPLDRGMIVLTRSIDR
jgi:hypothetical protein